MNNKQYFYTIVRDGKFINSNHEKEDTEYISEAIRFNDEVTVLKYWNSSIVEKMRTIYTMKIVEVECVIREYN